jgi:DNA replication protein DnaC
MLKDVIYSDERGTDLRQNLSQLATLDFIRKGQNVNIFGPTATGKSFLASALARKACASGFSTTYSGTRELIEDMKLKLGTAGYVNKRRSLKGRALLILDDFALTLYDNDDQAILFDVLNDRYGKKSTIIVSQKTPIVWNQEMSGTTLAQSIVSRASSNNFSLVLKGKSMRARLQFDSEMENPPEDIQESESTDDSVTANCNSYSYDELQADI